MSSAVFDNLMQNRAVKTDVLRELNMGMDISPSTASFVEDNRTDTQYSGGTFMLTQG